MGRPGNRKGAHFFHLTDSEKKDVYDLTQQGWTADEIAAWIGCCACTVRRHRKIIGKSRYNYHPRYWRPEEIETLVKSYNSGKDIDDIERAIGRSRESIYVMAYKLRKKGTIATKKKTGRKTK